MRNFACGVQGMEPRSITGVQDSVVGRSQMGSCPADFCFYSAVGQLLEGYRYGYRKNKQTSGITSLNYYGV